MNRAIAVNQTIALALFVCGVAAVGCSPTTKPEATGGRDRGEPSVSEEQRLSALRTDMVRQQLRGRRIENENVLVAMQNVPRHAFVPEHLQESAYEDRPLPIGHRQTISQPYIVALMTELARPKHDSRVLDVGTGSGYQAAVLAEIVRQVYSIEIVDALAQRASETLRDQGYENVEVRSGDGYQGWLEHAPFDVIIVAAAPDHVPQPLVDQLAPGGRLVIPVGRGSQTLLLIEKQVDGSIEKTTIAPVAFVPMTGRLDEPR